MDSIMALKDHSTFKFVHATKFLGQSKDEVFVFKVLIDLPDNGVKLIKYMLIGERHGTFMDNV